MQGIKSESDLNDFRAMLTKVIGEATLNAELEHHLGYQKISVGNSHNGYSSKRTQTGESHFRLEIPRDRNSSFEPEPELVKQLMRKAIKNRKLFSNNDSAKKVVYLAIMQASKKWTMPIRNWKPALNRFIIEFEDRISNYIN